MNNLTEAELLAADALIYAYHIRYSRESVARDIAKHTRHLDKTAQQWHELYISMPSAENCQAERAMGNGGCGACSICCKELFDRTEKAEILYKHLKASLPLVTNKTRNQADELLGEVLRHNDDDGTRPGASHGCVEVRHTTEVVTSLLADKDQLCEDLEELRLIKDQAKRLTDLICNSPPTTTIKGDIESLALALGMRIIQT